MRAIRRRHRAPPERFDALPLLAVDVDGVVLLLGDEGDAAPGTVRLELIDGMVRRVSVIAGECLQKLGDHFELVWATGWQARANDHFPGLLGIPRLSFVDFDGAARFGSAHWKLEPLGAYAEGRPLAWLDDNFDDVCFEWAAAREAPTLLVPTDPHDGLREDQFRTLLEWARSLPSL